MRRLILAVTLIIAGIFLVALTEHLDRASARERSAQEIRQELLRQASSLQAGVHELLGASLLLAKASSTPQYERAQVFKQQAQDIYGRMAGIISMVYVDYLAINLIYPLEGNEAIIGMDYSLHPEFMGKIRQMARQRTTVLDSTAHLIQTGRNGLIVRSPIFDGEAQSHGAAPSGDSDLPPDYRGMVAITMDLEGFIERNGLLPSESLFDLVIISHDQNELPRTLFGDPSRLKQPYASANVLLPNERWELIAIPHEFLAYDQSRAWIIRGTGASLILLLVLFMLHRLGQVRALGGAAASAGPIQQQLGGILQAHAKDSPKHRNKHQTSLRTMLMLATLAPLPLVMSLTIWLMYNTADQAVRPLELQQMQAVATQLRNRVAQFFDQPKSVVAFNIGQIEAGITSPTDLSLLERSLLLQMRQHPMLTFISFGSSSGHYLAASRYPQGPERSLRLLEASQEDQGQVRIYQVDDAGRRGALEFLGNPHFDPRARTWYQMAQSNNGIFWYPPYRYAMQDALGHYEDMGVGMAMRVKNQDGQVIGALTADLALSRISDFLRDATSEMDGVAFLVEESGLLLASSGPEPTYLVGEQNEYRISAEHSESTLISTAARRIQQSGQQNASQWLQIGAQSYLSNWQSIRLPDGPTLILCMVMAESPLARPAEMAMGKIGALIVVFWILGVLVALVAAWWIARPLRGLSSWANNLADGITDADPKIKSSVYEITQLSKALHNMALRIRSHSRQLELQVNQRTQELTLANKRLRVLSQTDGLTGLANRRAFDDALQEQYALARHQHSALSLILLDVDRFKDFNDEYGHQAGDDVLRQLAGVLAASLTRPNDLAARYGGEEFALILPGVELHQAKIFAEALRERVLELQISHMHAQNGLISISLGVASLGAPRVNNTDSLIAAADAALYRAKEQGRNQVQAHTG